MRWLELTLAGQRVQAEALAARGFSPPMGRDAWVDMVEQDRLLGDLASPVSGPIAGVADPL